MRLTELEPKWLLKDGVRIGILYRTPDQSHSWLATMFAPTPIAEQWDLVRTVGVNPDEVHTSNQTQGWSVEGNTFETLTLNPSINLVGVWHGWIKNGEVK